MKFTIESILGDKIHSRSSGERRQQVAGDDAIGRLRDDERSRPTSSAHASATELLLARAPQPIASVARPPQDCRKRNLSDGEEDDNMSGANIVAWTMYKL